MFHVALPPCKGQEILLFETDEHFHQVYYPQVEVLPVFEALLIVEVGTGSHFFHVRGEFQLVALDFEGFAVETDELLVYGIEVGGGQLLTEFFI